MTGKSGTHTTVSSNIKYCALLQSFLSMPWTTVLSKSAMYWRSGRNSSLCVCVCHVWVPLKAGRRHWIPWSLSCRQFECPTWMLEQNPDPLPWHNAPTTAIPALQPLDFFLSHTPVSALGDHSSGESDLDSPQMNENTSCLSFHVWVILLNSLPSS